MSVKADLFFNQPIKKFSEIKPAGKMYSKIRERKRIFQPTNEKKKI